MKKPLNPLPNPFEGCFLDVPEEEREAAQLRFARYIDLAYRIFTRISNDPKAYAEYQWLVRKGEKSPVSDSSDAGLSA